MTRVAWLLNCWKTFWTAPQSLEPLACFRIAFGFSMLEYCFVLLSHVSAYLGPHALCSAESARAYTTTGCLNVFSLLPQSETAVTGVLAVMALAAVCLCAGFCSRLSALVLWITLCSVTARDPYIMHSGNLLARVFSFYLIFAPTGAVWSVDAWLRRGGGVELEPQWWHFVAYRMCQVQLALVYWDAFWTKVQGDDWQRGLTVYYVLRLDAFRNLPLPAFLYDAHVCSALGVLTVVIEGMMWSLVWWPKTRYLVLCAGALLHFGLFWALNIPVFQPIMLSAYLLFIDGEDLRRLSSKPIAIINKWLPRAPLKLKTPIERAGWIYFVCTALLLAVAVVYQSDGQSGEHTSYDVLRGRAIEREAVLSKQLRGHPEDIQGWLELAGLQRTLGQWKGAEKSYKEASVGFANEGEWSSYEDALLALAALYRDWGRFHEAQEMYALVEDMDRQAPDGKMFVARDINNKATTMLLAASQKANPDEKRIELRKVDRLVEQAARLASVEGQKNSYFSAPGSTVQLSAIWNRSVGQLEAEDAGVNNDARSSLCNR